MFTEKFPTRVRAGMAITTVIDGITYTAWLHRDTTCDVPDKNDDGFWPSLDPDNPGYIGENPTHSYDEQMAVCELVMKRYKNGSLVYVGMDVTASKAGVTLVGEYTHSLWGIEVNRPGSDNSYLLEVANELLSDAIDTAKATLVLRIERFTAALAALKA